VTAEFPKEFDHAAAQALGQLVAEVVAEPSRRREFRDDPTGTARAVGVDVDNDRIRRLVVTLGSLSGWELRLLSELNQTLQKEDLYVETGNPPLMVF
jgi:hypothetical protein